MYMNIYLYIRRNYTCTLFIANMYTIYRKYVHYLSQICIILLQNMYNIITK